MSGNSRYARSRRLSGRRCTCALRRAPMAQTSLSFLSAYCEEPSAASLSACSCLKTKGVILADAAQRHKQPNSAVPLSRSSLQTPCVAFLFTASAIHATFLRVPPSEAPGGWATDSGPATLFVARYPLRSTKESSSLLAPAAYCGGLCRRDLVTRTCSSSVKST